MPAALPLTVKGACPHDCPDTCAWQVTVEDGAATDIRGSSDHPFTQGHLCAKVNHYLDRVYGEQRLRHPLRRVGPKGAGAFEQVSWEVALEEIAGALHDRIDKHGGETVLPFNYFGAQGLLQGLVAGARFFNALGATELIRGVCGSTGMTGVEQAMGTAMGIVPEDIVHSRFIVLWGTNPIVTNVHLWPFIRKAREAGATVVVVDPVRTRTAKAADWHIQPVPGTDVVLAMGIAHVLVREGLYDADYVSKHTNGAEDFFDAVADYSPERVARECGLDADDIERLARAYASTPASCIRLLIGLEHRAGGVETFRTISYLPALTGAWRHRGGGLLYLTAEPHWRAMNTERLYGEHLREREPRSVNMIQLGRALTDESVDPPITALMVHAANPAVTMPHQNLIVEGLQREDVLTVVHEQVMTDTARYADYVLPATTQVEHTDLMWAWGHDYIALNQPAIAAIDQAVPTTEYFRRLSSAMGLEDPDLYLSDSDMIDIALDSEEFRAQGVTRETLARVGWVRLSTGRGATPFSDGGFPTADGRISLEAPSTSGPQLPPGRWPLHLVSGKGALHFLNSSYSYMPRHVRAEGKPFVAIDNADARARGIAGGDAVEVVNARGAVRATALVGGVRQGMVALDSGWAHRSDASVNALTSDGLSRGGDGGDFHDTFVDVRPVK